LAPGNEPANASQVAQVLALASKHAAENEGGAASLLAALAAPTSRTSDEVLAFLLQRLFEMNLIILQAHNDELYFYAKHEHFEGGKYYILNFTGDRYENIAIRHNDRYVYRFKHNHKFVKAALALSAVVVPPILSPKKRALSREQSPVKLPKIPKLADDAIVDDTVNTVNTVNTSAAPPPAEPINIKLFDTTRRAL
jgi:hypothetical protein